MIKHPPLPLPSFYYPSFRAEIKVGDEIAVMAIGHLNSQGVFWVRFLDFDKISQIQYIRALLRTTTANYLCLCGLVPLDVKDRYCDEAAAQVGLENYLALKLRCGGRPNTSTIPL